MVRHHIEYLVMNSNLISAWVTSGRDHVLSVVNSINLWDLLFRLEDQDSFELFLDVCSVTKILLSIFYYRSCIYYRQANSIGVTDLALAFILLIFQEEQDKLILSCSFQLVIDLAWTLVQLIIIYLHHKTF